MPWPSLGVSHPCSRLDVSNVFRPYCRDLKTPATIRPLGMPCGCSALEGTCCINFGFVDLRTAGSASGGFGKLALFLVMYKSVDLALTGEKIG